MTVCCPQVLGNLRQNTSSICRNLSRTSDATVILRRCYATERVKKLMRQEQLKNQVFQYVGKNTKKADRVYVWGYAATGALGVKRFLMPEKNQNARTKQLIPHRLDLQDKYNVKAHDVACGYGFTVYLCHTGLVNVAYGTGINTDSQLGYQEYPRNSGHATDYVIEPVPIELPLLQPQSTQLLQVACGRAHTVIVTDTEGDLSRTLFDLLVTPVFSLGNNSYGQCGRSIVSDEVYRASQTINKVNLDTKVRQAVCGQDHTLFLTDEGQVYSCGLGADGQTGLGHYNAVGDPCRVKGDIDGEKVINMSSKGDCVLAVSDRGEVFGWGNSEYNQLASVASDSTQVETPRHLHFDTVGRVSKVAAAGTMCALLNDQGEVYVWGYGLLGKGPKLESSPWPSLLPPPLFGRNDFSPDTRVVDIDCGLNHLAAITDNGDVYVWGHNKTACLGLGHVLDQFFPFKVNVPAEVRKVACGVDHTVVLSKSFA
ncbi:RCC1-like G exchanging factor-like protein [Lamellibrachia satsuma]|nr:RCC1-like G exchanging factor-like protein [Lamellibrachia satsuma]